MFCFLFYFFPVVFVRVLRFCLFVFEGAGTDIFLKMKKL